MTIKELYEWAMQNGSYVLTWRDKMSFADQLRKNYEGPKPSDKKLYIKEITEAARDAASKASRNSKTVSGYFCKGYEDYIIDPQNAELFLYKADLGYRAHLIKGFWPNIEQAMFTPQERSQIVETVRKTLEKDGFSTVIVRAEDTKRPVQYGHTEILHKPKTKDFPAFKIFISLAW